MMTDTYKDGMVIEIGCEEIKEIRKKIEDCKKHGLEGCARGLEKYLKSLGVEDDEYDHSVVIRGIKKERCE